MNHRLWRRTVSRLVAALPVLGGLGMTTMAADLATIDVADHVGLAYAAQPVHYTVAIGRGALRDAARCTLRDAGGKPVLAQFKALDAWDDGSVRHLRVSFITAL